MEPSSPLSAASERIPIEILLSIIRRCPPSSIARFARCSFACLEISSPLLYNYVVLKDVGSLEMFFAAPNLSPSSAPHLLPFTSRTQTKHLHIEIPRLTPEEARSNQPTPLLRSPSSGPLLLESYSNVYGRCDFKNLINPSLVILHSEFATPTLFGHVQWKSMPSHLVPTEWDRVRDVVLFGCFPDEPLRPIPPEWAREWRDLRITMDLSMIENIKTDPRNPNGSCQRLVKRFVETLKEKVRGRIGVGSEEVQRMFEVAVEELMAKHSGKALELELRRLPVEILTITKYIHRT
ncbi:hypothetical protein BDY24DRAFT_444396 [Mrakia frigida]|uniref:uncharacterized protein n=1 Tax=Mrakia frigida TaxID=29902 RepID=UPI003FCBFA49